MGRKTLEENSWRDKILREFPPKVARLTLVSDPDGVFCEERLVQQIRARGFELLFWEDPVAFRYLYESRFRSRWDLGEEAYLVVVVPSAALEETLPYDLLQMGRKLFFSLARLFPWLSPSVVAALDSAYWDVLFQAQRDLCSAPLGEEATKDFLLRHVFGIATELIQSPVDLLQMLLRLHYQAQRLPSLPLEWLIEKLWQNPKFRDWPLKEILPCREAFFQFLQERWQVFVDSFARNGEAVCENRVHHLQFAGPSLLPFQHKGIRVYLDNLFAEGLLQPVEHPRAEVLVKQCDWMACGVQTSARENWHRRVERLFKILEEKIEPPPEHYGTWLEVAPLWAELEVLLLHKGRSFRTTTQEQRWKKLQHKLDDAFVTWAKEHYPNLIQLPALPPPMVHHIPRYLASFLKEHHKVALVVVDGLSWSQWVVVREVLFEQVPSLLFQQRTVFAWIPTVTSISRQAIFAGKPPLYFSRTLYRTDAEPWLWQQFWQEQGEPAESIAYRRGENLSEVAELLLKPELRVLGLVIGTVDRILHGEELGAEGMLAQVQRWAETGFLKDLLELLHDQGFSVFLTSDHGNVEGQGIGQLREGVLPHLRGERVRVYQDASLARQAKQRFPGSWLWPPIGLPEGCFPLLAPSRSAFVEPGRRVMAHGGVSVEEVLVPFVQVRQKI